MCLIIPEYDSHAALFIIIIIKVIPTQVYEHLKRKL